jgi:PAN domain
MSQAELQQLIDEYSILLNAYEIAINEYKTENQNNIVNNVLMYVKNVPIQTFYIGNYSNLSNYYNATNIINSIEVYYNLTITLYKSVNFTGPSVTYSGSIPNQYSKFNLNSSYQSLKITYTNNNYSIASGKQFQTPGEKTVVTSEISSAEDCATACMNNNNCTAAVYNSNLNTCGYYTTPGTIEKGNSSSQIIIPSNKKKLLIISQLNAKLEILVNQITATSKKVLDENKQSYNNKMITMREYEEKIMEINALQNITKEKTIEYKSLDSELNNTQLIVSKNVSIYYLMWIVFIILMIIIIKQLVFPDKNDPDTVVWFILILAILLASYNIKNAYGYFLWCILILIFVLKIILPRL